MDFYTNIIQRGNTLFVRGVDGNQRVTDKVNYCPTLYNLTDKGRTGYKTLDGRDVLPHTQGGVWHRRCGHGSFWVVYVARLRAFKRRFNNVQKGSSKIQNIK